MCRQRVMLGFLALVAGCGDGGAQLSDGGSDGPVPFALPAGSVGHADVGAALKPGEVRAGRVSRADQLLAGIKVQGQVGDYKLYNDRVAFVIRDERATNGFARLGGKLLDGARLGQPGALGESLLGETIFFAGTRILEPSSVGVVSDGSDGQPALVRVIGEPAPWPLLTGLLGESIGAVPALRLVVDYVLAPKSDVLEVRVRLFNKTRTGVKVPMAGIVCSDGDGVRFFVEGVGFDVGRAQLRDSLALVGPTVSYVLHTPGRTLQPLLLYGGLWMLSNGAVDVPPAGEIEHRYLLGLSAGAPESARQLLRQLRGEGALPRVTGTVRAGQPLAGARVHVEQESGAYVTMARTNEQGGYSVELSAGRYLFRVAADGHELSEATAVVVDATGVRQDLALEGSGTLAYAVHDEQDAAIPAQLVLERDPALRAAPPSFGESTYPGSTSFIIFSPRGSGTAALPPGTYHITASRGFEYELAKSKVSLASGSTVSSTLQLARSVDTTGYMCGDFHLHGRQSPDSSDGYPLKLAALAAAGVELAVITEHEYVSDMGPDLVKLGLQPWVNAMIGEEVTTLAYGHFNPFPLVQRPTLPNQGAIEWAGKSPPALFAELHATWPDALLQINHPRDLGAGGGYFAYVGYDPATGATSVPAHWSRSFDAVELFNGSGWTSNSERSVLDWYSLLSRGLRVTATGGSDSHDAYWDPVGYPRNCVQLGTDQPAQLDRASFVRAVRDQHVVVSGGPFVTASVGGKGLGEVANATARKVEVTVKVQAPTWMPLDTLRLVVGGVEARRVTLDSSTADPHNPVIRYQGSLEITVERDSWVVVVVTGAGTLTPVSFEAEPFAVTNPIYLDVDGNGKYDPSASL